MNRPTHTAFPRALWGGLFCALTACSSGGPHTVPEVARLGESGPVSTLADPPEGADPNACYARDVTPAVIETVTEQVVLQPAQVSADGTVLYPAVYKTETRQRIVQDRREHWFETVCETQMTPEFIASLQRALAVRGYYRGPATGEINLRTRRAVRRYQAEQGLDSAVLSADAARRLGLISVPREGGVG